MTPSSMTYAETPAEKVKPGVLVAAKRVDLVSLRLVRESTITYPPRRIRCAADAVDLVRPMIETSDREVFVCVHLNTKHEPVAIIVCSVGSLDATIVHPREVLKAACISNASAILCAHNHPSGDPSPSNEDIAVTKRLDEASRILGIDFLDHIVIGSEGRFESIRERGWN